jgi:hypothetical protein
METPSSYFLPKYTLNYIRLIKLLSCNGTNDYVKVSDCAQEAPTQCGSTLYGKLLMESVSNLITVDFSVIGSAPSSLYKGFQMYIEGKKTFK